MFARRRPLCAECCHETPQQQRGEHNGFAKLTEQDILAIRSETGTQVEIGKKYGIHRSNVSLIRRKFTWSHV